jgi:serine protease Do
MKIIMLILLCTNFINAEEKFQIDKGFSEIIEKVKDSVVNITVKMSKEAYQRRIEEMRRRYPFMFPPGEELPPDMPLPIGSGSGTIIDKEGYILTNFHVVDGAKSIKVTLSNRKTYTAKFIGASPRNDLAIIKIIKPLDFLTPIKFGDSDFVKEGEWVIAVGNPFGRKHSVSAGIVSAKERVMEVPYGSEVKRLGGLIQIDAPINPGNSGGPLINTKGEIIGINTIAIMGMAGSSGIGYAIPINTAKKLIPEMLKGKKDVGENIPVIGIQMQGLDDALEEAFGVDTGVIIVYVDKDAPAGKVGLEVGDVIVKIDEHEIKDSEDLRNVTVQKNVGEKINITYVRDGEKKLVSLTLEKLEPIGYTSSERRNIWPRTPWQRPTQPRIEERMEIEGLGLELGKTREGIIVTDIKSSTPADDSDIEEGDRILMVNKLKEEITFDSIKSEVEKTSSGKYIKFLTEKGRERKFVVIKKP